MTRSEKLYSCSLSTQQALERVPVRPLRLFNYPIAETNLCGRHKRFSRLLKQTIHLQTFFFLGRPKPSSSTVAFFWGSAVSIKDLANRAARSNSLCPLLVAKSVPTGRCGFKQWHAMASKCSIRATVHGQAGPDITIGSRVVGHSPRMQTSIHLQVGANIATTHWTFCCQQKAFMRPIFCQEPLPKSGDATVNCHRFFDLLCSLTFNFIHNEKKLTSLHPNQPCRYFNDFSTSEVEKFQIEHFRCCLVLRCLNAPSKSGLRRVNQVVVNLAH